MAANFLGLYYTYYSFKFLCYSKSNGTIVKRKSSVPSPKTPTTSTTAPQLSLLTQDRAGRGMSLISDTPANDQEKCSQMQQEQNPKNLNKSANISNNSLTSDSPNELPEKEEYQIELRKDNNGLGITIAGYVCEKGKHLTLKSPGEILV